MQINTVMGARVPDGGINRTPELAGVAIYPSDVSLATTSLKKEKLNFFVVFFL